ncbi:hypothetical protein Nepgr_019498 [Nepenthes gracilis]|uniref:Lipoyl-binding domain-containing protein n=1 Tax=Nepenthes gracilis TaxID=150966 RepID=A0AAD3SW85_NEPGR|nr:hypothetical protein Nepgr_019498 [Nepenthes gracilis]
MAAGSTGALNSKILNCEFNRRRFCTLHPPCGIQSWNRLRVNKHASFVVSLRLNRALTVSCGPSLSTESAKIVEEENQSGFSGLVSQLIPAAHEVESLLTELCDTTSIAEFELKLHGFRLYVTRGLTKNTEPPAAPTSDSIVVNSMAEAAGLNGSVSVTSLAVSKQAASEGKTESLLDKAADEGLVLIQSPRVGLFRRSRTIKGKRAPPACKEKQIVKEGQVLCYIEQLGGELPVESDVSGEIVKILHEDGDPVGYGDPVIEILPSFPGI